MAGIDVGGDVAATANGQPGVALVTGASKRIGRAIAVALAAEGWAIAVHYRSSRDDADALVRDISGSGGSASAIAADLSKIKDLSAMVDAAERALGPVTCLVNNASEFHFDTVETLTPEGWAAHLDTNLRAPVFLAQAMVARLPEAATGNVINLIDQRVWRPTPEYFSYAVSKAGLWDATRMLAQALAPRVRVNAIGPGPVLQSVHQTPEAFEAEAHSTLLRRATPPQEIADAVRFILSAPALTGQMIALDAGQHLTWTSERDVTPADGTDAS